MPRTPRLKSQSGIYHIMLRGINQQIIFEDDEDYFKFIETLKIYKAISGYNIFAYCLMSNQKQNTRGRRYCASNISVFLSYGNLSSETDPMGYKEEYSYNLLGQLVAETDKNGTEHTYNYDILNRLLSKVYVEADNTTDSVQYTYNMLGNVISMVDNTGTTV